MFYKSIGAANKRVMVSSFSSEDEQVSQFVAFASGKGIPESQTFELSSLTLRGTAGWLRRRLATEADPSQRKSLALDLARLAAAGVAGAHPEEWYGLQEASTTEQLFEFTAELAALEIPGGDEDSAAAMAMLDRGPRITLNPSQLDSFLRCPLHWFLENHGGKTGDFSASVGTLIHQAMELSTAVDEASLWQFVESGWHNLRFESEWLEQAERRRAQAAVANLAKYLTEFQDQGGLVLAREQEFQLDIGRAHIRGKVDRIEQRADGSVIIVDLKTGSRIPTIEEGKRNPQLGLYQLAYLNGAFQLAQPAPDTVLAGAKLLLVGGGNKTEREQDSLQNDPANLEYFQSLVVETAEGMAMPDRVFFAQASSHCTNENEFGSCGLHLRKAVSYAG